MPHVIYLAIGFPPAAKSSTYRLRATANLMAERGWDVTAVTIHDEAWRLESGLDTSLLADVHPRIDVVKLPLSRPEFNPDISTYSWLRARHPGLYLKMLHQRNKRSFPEPSFGGWRKALEGAVLEIHRRKPADLMLMTVTPYTGLAAGWRLWKEHRVPYAIDYRDGWSVDVINDGEAFTRTSRQGRWETKLVGSAERVWCVNQMIRDFYAARYPDRADRIKVVRNGWDPFTEASVIEHPDRQFTFGYLGTAVFPLDYTKVMLEGWRLARQRDEFISAARLEFRGHFGFAAGGIANSHTRRISGYSVDDVHYDGPVPKGQVASLYDRWDALVFAISGGAYMTSGKIYEYMATGLPIMSVHEAEHGAHEVLEGYPLWVPPPKQLTAEAISDSFIATARMASDADPTVRKQAVDHAARFARRTVMADAVDDLLGSVARE